MQEVLEQSSVSSLERALGSSGRANLLGEEHSSDVADEMISSDQRAIIDHLERRGIDLKGRVIPTTSCPYLMTEPCWQAISSRFERFFPILERVIDLYLESAEVRRFFELAPRHDVLIRMPTVSRERIVYCRFDFSLDRAGTPRIYEFNTHCPGAAVTCTEVAQAFGNGRIHAHLEQELGLRSVRLPLDRAGAFSRALMAAAQEHGYVRDGQTVAVLNSRYLTLSYELERVRAELEEQGYTARRSFVEDLSFDGRTLLLDGRPVSVALNKYDDSRGPDAFECAFSRTTAEVQAYINAYAAGAVFPINTFPAQFLTEQKTTLAFLWSPLARRLLGREELDQVEELVPRSRIVRRLEPGEVDEAVRSKDGYALKRSLDTRGRGVVIGSAVSAEEWAQALRSALDDRLEHWVLQEAAPAESFSSRQTELTSFDCPTFTAFACYIFNGRPAGILVRTSADPTTNVAKKGFVQPLMVVESPL